MKKILLVVCAAIASMAVWAQDIIVTKDAKKIEAKIMEVSTSEIRYKELDNLDGPIFILRTDEINCIMYANGKVVLYNQNDAKKEEENKRLKAKADSLFGRISSEDPGGQNATRPGKGQGCGYGTSGDYSWSLAGREIVGRLPKPGNTFNQEGKVVVQIRVNAAGDVIEAKVIGGSISDRQTIQLAIEAAKKAKFTALNYEQIGTITYTFKFN